MCALYLTMLACAGFAGHSYGGVLQSDLTSPDVFVRWVAIERLENTVAGDPTVLRDPHLQETITELLESENALISTNLDGVADGRPHLLPEDYGEHYARVLRMADRLRELTPMIAHEMRTRLLRVLVMSSYNPESPLAMRLAKEGERIVPHVLHMAEARHEPARWNAHALSAFMFGYSASGTLNAPLSAASREALKLAARAGLSDPMAGVRRHAIDTVVAAGDREALPLLARLAETDPDADDGPTPYSVRSRARKALLMLGR